MVSKSSTKKLKQSTPKESKSSASPRTVIGKIYSDECIHCTRMQPEWDKMKENIKNKCNNYNVPEPDEYLEIETSKDLQKLEEFNQNNLDFLQNSEIKYKYVPTIFVIDVEGIKYYDGERTCDKMEKFMVDRYYKHHGIPVSIGGKKSKKTNKTRKNKTRKNKTRKNKTKKNFFAIFGF